MPDSPRNILVTSALPYANGPIHLGHLVEYVQTDIWVRFQRLRGHRCIYVCADDAHGTPIMLKAEKDGVTPEALIERVGEEHRRDFADFMISFDNYYSTHSPENREYAELIYRLLAEAGHISARTITQAYDPEREMFLPDRYIKGECPRCGSADPVRRQLRGVRGHLCTYRSQESPLGRFRRHTRREGVTALLLRTRPLRDDAA